MNDIPHLNYRKKPAPEPGVIRAEIDARLRYERETGCFYWVCPPGPNGARYIGKRAGGVDGKGYLSMNLLSNRFKMHRLVWLMEHGIYPIGIIDHINGDKQDNRIENLRIATMAQNVLNRIRSGHLRTGVCQNSNNTFQSRIQLPSGRKVNLGTYPTEAEATAAYAGAEILLNEEFSMFASRGELAA